MAWLDGILNWIFKDQLAGLRLEDPSPLLFRLPRDPARFLRALPILAGPDATVCFEGSTEERVRRWLEEHGVPPRAKISAGTVLPVSDFYHVPLGPEALTGLAALVEAHGIATPSIHVYVYEGERVTVAWYDAFYDHPVFISRAVPAERVAAFAAAAGGEAVSS